MMKRYLTLICLALSLNACANTAPSVKPVPEEQSEYTLGVGDSLRIVVFGQDQLTGEYAVEPNGMISFPLVDDVPAAGYTASEVEQNIASRLSPDYLLDPKVSVDVLEFRSIYVLGEVQQPGKFEFVPNMTVMQAVAIAGGYTYRANENTAEVTRHVKGALSTFTVDDRTMLKPGDTVLIKRRWF